MAQWIWTTGNTEENYVSVWVTLALIKDCMVAIWSCARCGNREDHEASKVLIHRVKSKEPMRLRCLRCDPDPVPGYELAA